MIKTQCIVCPTDFSPTATSAVDHAVAMAKAFHAKLVLMHVLPPRDPLLRGLAMAAVAKIQSGQRRLAKEHLMALRAQVQGDVEALTEIRSGDAYDQILACAKAHAADLIVMGTHGYTGLKHALIGSTAERVVRLSECPVLTVRGTGRRVSSVPREGRKVRQRPRTL